jgi:succinate dehydrogenase flavin-adding protein (antitoxin of CptAB toxin-antitoxin module)
MSKMREWKIIDGGINDVELSNRTWDLLQAVEALQEKTEITVSQEKLCGPRSLDVFRKAIDCSKQHDAVANFSYWFSNHFRHESAVREEEAAKWKAIIDEKDDEICRLASENSNEKDKWLKRKLTEYTKLLDAKDAEIERLTLAAMQSISTLILDDDLFTTKMDLTCDTFALITRLAPTVEAEV